ncbi:PP-loop family protein [Besnoitia besnoiti]|uniref:PP-loop family protein n=1 Tax=Besnoitia besnoiti TaxID=94643 RepID=A0A2A9ME73_BESBE|nr:PP-loop family protein [Besnoitia besnoiti]PFH33927.1 PP-loop family protein [Besnoitia besnoiti]
MKEAASSPPHPVDAEPAAASGPSVTFASPSACSSTALAASSSSCSSKAFPPMRCQFCGSPRVSLVRVASRLRSCRSCFIRAFEDEVLAFIRQFSLLRRGQKVAVCVSGGKDSVVLLHVLHTLNERENLGLSLHLLAVDEGIKGYRDHALASVQRNSQLYQLPLHVVSYDALYQGWTMDRIAAQDLAMRKASPPQDDAKTGSASAAEACAASAAASSRLLSSASGSRLCSCRGGGGVGGASCAGAPRDAEGQQPSSSSGDRDQIPSCCPSASSSSAASVAEKRGRGEGDKASGGKGFTHSCTFCGIFRRQAFERGAQDIGADVLCTGHNADDGAETFLMNILRGDVQRLPVSGAPLTGSSEGPSVMRVKPLFAAYQKEIVLYAHFTRLDYFATECTYSGAAYRGLVRNFLSSLQDHHQQQRVLDLLRAARMLWQPPAPALPAREEKEGLVSARGGGREGDEADVVCGGGRGETEKRGSEEDAAWVEDASSTEACGLPSAEPDSASLEVESPQPAPHTRASSVSGAAASSKSASCSCISAGRNPRARRESAQAERERHPPQKPDDLRPCVLCGFLTKNDFCRACALVKALNENKLNFVGLSARKAGRLMDGEGNKPKKKAEKRNGRAGASACEKGLPQREQQACGGGDRTEGLRGSLAW